MRVVWPENETMQHPSKKSFLIPKATSPPCVAKAISVQQAMAKELTRQKLIGDGVAATRLGK
jgi:hypothetical protein